MPNEQTFSSGAIPPVEAIVEPGGLRAYLPVLHPKAAPTLEALADTIRAALRTAGVVRGINENAIVELAKTVIEMEQPLRDLTIALGKPAVKCVDGRLKCHFQVGGENPVTSAAKRASGEIASTGLSKKMVRAGDVLATFYPGEPGKDGFTVTGMILKAASPENTPPKAGPGVTLSPDGATYTVAEGALGYADYLDNTILVEEPVRVSSDSMAIVLTAQPPSISGSVLERADVERWLAEHGVMHGVRGDAISEALNAACKTMAPVTDALIARGTPPVAGENARIEYYFRREKLAGALSADGKTVDYHERGLLQKVEKDAVLARKFPATAGTPGMDVFGRELPAAPGTDAPLKGAGQAALSDDGLICFAREEGIVSLVSEGTVGVFQIYELPGDVDFKSGNLDMNGTLNIKGWVRSGFKVHASGDIFIGEGIEDAAVDSGANIVVQRGVLGGEHCSIECYGGIAAKFIENAHVWSSGDVVVHDGILNSDVTAEGRVVATEGNGHILGGVIRGAKGIEAKEIGSRAATRTVVDAGIDSASRVQLAEMERECATFERNRLKISKTVSALVQKGRQGKLTPPETQTLAKLVRYRRNIELKRNKIANFKKRLREGDVTIKVHRAVYEGTVVYLMGWRAEIREDLRQPGRFVLDLNEGRVLYKT